MTLLGSWRALILILLLLTVGCASGPQYVLMEAKSAEPPAFPKGLWERVKNPANGYLYPTIEPLKREQPETFKR